MTMSPIHKSFIAKEVAELLASYIDLDPANIAPGQSLSDLGIDSFQLIEIVFAIEERFNIHVDLEKLQIKSYSDVVDVIATSIAVREKSPSLR
jgi:acyl carrier protein